jgi:hypothetical protein
MKCVRAHLVRENRGAVGAADGGQRPGNRARLLRPDKNQEAFKQLREGFHRSPPQILVGQIICPGDRWNQPAILSALRFFLPDIFKGAALG